MKQRVNPRLMCFLAVTFGLGCASQKHPTTQNPYPTIQAAIAALESQDSLPVDWLVQETSIAKVEKGNFSGRPEAWAKFKMALKPNTKLWYWQSANKNLGPKSNAYLYGYCILSEHRPVAVFVVAIMLEYEEPQ